MPELPEVETIAKALRPHFRGRKIKKVVVCTKMLRYPIEFHQHEGLLSGNIIDVRRRAKYIIVEFDTLQVLLIHLGMTGSFRIQRSPVETIRHDHVVLFLDDGNTVIYNDPRKFGFFKFCSISSPGSVPLSLQCLPPEPLGSQFDSRYLKTKLCGRKKAIKAALMDNALVCGVGNIYSCEALFDAGISPLTAAGALSLTQCQELVTSIKKVLKKSIKLGGTTISDFKKLDGSEGKFQIELKVYGNEGHQCGVCKKEEIRKMKISGRSTFYCPSCQH